MTMTSPFHANALRARVQETHERVARNPYGQFHLHRGPYYARHYLGYDGADLQGLPQVALDRFIGVGNPFSVGEINPGERILSLGCGAGTDALIAARRVGPQGRVVGLDESPAMRTCARMAIRASGLADWVEIRDGRPDALPLADESVDLVIANGVLYLAADRGPAFSEIQRVLRPGGRLYLADLVVDRAPAFSPSAVADLWSAVLAGVLLEDELSELAVRAGLRQGRLVSCYDCLRNTPLGARLPAHLRFHAATLSCVK